MEARMRLSFCVMVLCGTALHQVRAQDSLALKNHLHDRFQLSISGAQVWLGPKVRVDAGNGTPGTDIDGKDVGASNSTLEPRLALRWRLGTRHELDVGYQFARRDGGRVLAETIYVADTSFAAGLRIESAFKADQAFLNYHFAFRVRERSQIGAALGVGVLFFHVDIDAISGATSGGPDTTITPYSASKGINVPTLSLGLYGRWRTGDRWYIESDARALKFAYGRVGVLVLEGGAAARYFVKPRFGVELGYGLSGLRVTLDPKTDGTPSVTGRLRFTLQNLRLGVIATP
jgi:hypothetical protein